MSDEARTRDQLINELNDMRRKVKDLESRLRQVAEPSAQWGTQHEKLRDEIEKRTHLERELGDTDRLYRTLVETAKDITWTVDLNLRYTYVSPSVTEVLGYSVEEIMALRPLDGLTPDSRERVMKAFQEELAWETAGPREKYASRTEEIERYHKDGSTHWEEITTTFLRDNQRRPIGILGISHDITGRKSMEADLRKVRDELEQRVEERAGELLRANARLQEEIRERKQAEDALRESEQRLELALNGADLGLWDWYVQTDQAVINRRTAEIVGYELDEVETRFGFWEGLVHPKDRLRAVNTVQAYLEGRTDHYEDEYRVKAKSGEWKWIFSRGKVVERDLEGKPLRMAGTYRDITVRKRAEEVLRESEQRYRAVVDNIQVGISLLDSHMEIVDVNRAFKEYFPHVRPGTGQICYEQYNDPPRSQPCSYCPCVRTLQDGKVHEAVTETPTGSEIRYYHLVSSPIKDANGRVLYVIELTEDITDRKRAEEALRLSEERYRRMFEDAPLMYVITRNEGGVPLISNCNELFLSSVGYTREAVVGQRLAAFYSPESRAEMLERGGYTRALAGEFFIGERQLLTRDGRLIPTLLYTATEEDHSGQVIGTRAMFVDISEHKKAEQALRESEERFKQVAENAGEWIWEVDADGVYRYCNSAVKNILGYSPDELVGKRHFYDLFAPDVREGLKEQALVAFGRKETLRNVVIPNVHKNGEIRLLETSGSPVQDSEGNFLGYRGAQTNITDRKKAEDALRSEREQLLSIFESINEVILVIDPRTYEILFANKFAEDLFGKNLIGGTCYEKLNGLDSPCGHCAMDRVMELQGKPYKWEYHNLVLDKDFLATDRMIRWSDGSEVKFQIAIDITERNIAAQEKESLRTQLLQAQKMEAIGTLAGGIAHDFNNLLQITLGYSELLLDDKAQEDPEYADLKKIHQAARSGAELVRNLLTFSRKAEPEPVPMSLNNEIRHVEKLLRRTIPRMIDIRLDLTDDIERINADRAQIEQIVMNLAVNARDAMGGEGSLVIRTENVTLDEEYCEFNVEAKPGYYVLLSVSDTGRGMDRATLQHIFEPFFTTKELGRGTGLGLAMVYGIVKQHGGHLTCHSEVGRGTTFRIYLPALEEETEPDVESSGPMPAFGTETVLLVDDEELVRELGERILTRSGYTVLVALNGEQALEVYGREKDHVALVILDLIMPTMGGKDCLKKILQIDPRARVLIASGYSADASTKECAELGAKGFVAKPFRFKELLKQVRKTLDQG